MRTPSRLRVLLIAEACHPTGFETKPVGYHLARALASRDDLEHVEARQTSADELAQMVEQNSEQFDLIIINSVAQYFPDLEYLLDTLATAEQLLSENGRIFLGDLRSLPLLESYHASVQLFQAENESSTEKLGERFRQRVEQEEELLLDPEFTRALSKRLPTLKSLQLNLKRGTARNEMSCFRYDAILGKSSSPRTLSAPKYEWQINSTLDDLRTQLQSLDDKALLVTGIGDARLQPEMEILAELANPADENTVGSLRNTIETAETNGVQPEELFSLAKETGTELQTIGTAPGRFNALFTPGGSIADGRLLLPARDLTLEQCANNPMQGRIQRSLVPALKEHLRASLPDYMVPGVFSILDQFPLTPNGKIDRKALPAPEQGSTQTYTPPRNETEETLVSIWEDLLGIDQAGVLDDFFGLGGHSLLATQLISRIRDQLEVNLPLNSLFDNPTIAGLAEAIATLRWALTGTAQDDDSDDDEHLEEIEI